MRHTAWAAGPRWLLFAGMVLVAMGVFGGARRGFAGHEDRRVSAGVRLFRSLLAADLHLNQKTVDDGRLLVVFFYVRDAEGARDLAAAFRGGEGASGGGIRGMQVVTEQTADFTLGEYERRRPAGVFISEVPDETRLRTIIQYGIANGVVVYSPFEGHVESGVLGGMVVEAQVRPYVNTRTLQASGISLKSFFMKVTKAYP